MTNAWRQAPEVAALARGAAGEPSFPDYEAALTSASLVVVPALVLAELDDFLRDERVAMRKLIAEIFDEDLQASDSETTIELNFAVLKFKHTIKKKNK